MTMQTGFQIRHWAALAPGLCEAGDWLAWARHPVPPTGALEAPLAAMPAMQRRRVERVGRLALEVAYAVDGQGRAPDFAHRPMVFASRHGDVLRSVGLLEALDRGEPLSPTQFGLSVHNAVAAQYGIARSSTAPYSAVAGGRCSAEAGLWEALGYFDEGYEEVLLVVFDEPPPSLFARDADEPAIPFAWALRIAPATAGGFQLQPGAGEEAASAVPGRAALPHGLAVLAYLLAPVPVWTVKDDDGCWCWRYAG